MSSARCGKSRIRGFDLGVVDYILKPFDATELVSRLHGLLERLEPPFSAEMDWEMARVEPLRLLRRSSV